MKRRNSLSYPGNNIRIFVKWYKNLIKKINKHEFKNIIEINFENFFQNFKLKKRKLSTKLDISHDCKDNFNLQHTLKNLFKYRKNLTNEEILYIDKNLNEE